ncbi:DUF3098 domain-containing protein [Spirosoma radiotolerans]|uniref:DUF3098 domain-containing protein n=1 Tax=Spirosoma radiotolerans TaxID=1379870 RepID=A0A0E3ZY60_9BACT|nr:DUF3098 domain-containing protein [Spirosoma radiotolerans]AKD56633.1 hypothetical protein SD10_18750 [Spirosoma radiotolerans]
MAKDKQAGVPILTRDQPAPKIAATTTLPPKAAPTRSSVVEPVRRDTAAALPFGRQNYTLMLAGIGIILAGFFIMSLDKEEFGFGFLGLTLGPLVVMGGFVLEFFAILARPKA